MENLQEATLDQLQIGEGGVIVRVSDEENQSPFLELGFFEGTHVKVAYDSPFGGDPIAVEIRGTLVALHKSDAKNVIVKRTGV